MNSKLLAICVGRSEALFFDSPTSDPTSNPTSDPAPTREPAPAHRSAIRKKAISTLDHPEPVAVEVLGVAGDDQVDRTVHGGPTRAIYAYPAEHYAFWTTVRAQARQHEPLAWGAIGENLVLQGLLETRLWLGDHVYIGAVQLRVEAPRQPCFKFNTVMGFRQASKMMVQSGFTGIYLSVLQPGVITAGDSVRVVPGDRVLSLTERHTLLNRSPQRSLW
jgi:MOSC domain-containing protein YiiM